jgi:peptidoglycan/xylan/chitin deacetylase (PgdA/CDA1 family)
MDARAEAVLDRVMRRSPAQTVCRRRNANRLAVLAYHGVAEPEAFEAQIDYLTACMRPVDLAEVASAIAGDRRLPPHSVLVTFDDGDRTVLDNALPILEARGVPAVAFVVTALLGTDDPFWWDEVEWLVAHGAAAGDIAPTASPADAVRALKQVPDARRRAAIEELRASAALAAPRRRQLLPAELGVLEAGGVQVGSHTVTHPILQHCDAAQLAREVQGSRDVLGEMLGRPPISFAYPNGDRDATVRAAIGDAGYSLAFLFDHSHASIPPRDALQISRLRVDASAPLDRFATIVSGLHPVVHRLRGGA